MAELLSTGGASVGPGVLEPAGVSDTLGMGPADRMRLRELHADLDEVRRVAAELHSEAEASLLDTLGAAAIDGERIHASMLERAGSDVLTAEGMGNKVAALAKESMGRDVLRAAPAIGATAVGSQMQPWEKLLYDNMSRSEAFRVANYLTRQVDLTDTDRAALAAEISQTTQPVPGDVLIEPPQFPAPPPPPKPPDNPSGLPPCPPKDQLERCRAFGAGGPCINPNGVVVYMGDIPDILTGPPGTPSIPEDDEMIAMRAAGASSIKYDVGSSSWIMVGHGSHMPTCVIVPPVPPTTTTVTPVPPTVFDPIPPPSPPGTCPPMPPEQPNCPVLLAPGTVVIVPTITGGGPTYPPMPPIIPPVPPTGGGSSSSTTITSPVPPPPPPPPPASPEPPKPDLRTPCSSLDDINTICLSLDTAMNAAGLSGQIMPATRPPSDSGSGPLDTLAGINKWLWGSDPGDVTEQSKKNLAWLQKFVNRVLEFAKGKDAGCECHPAEYVALATRLFLPNFVEQWLGIPIKDIFADVDYARKYSCPTMLPGQPAIDDLYLAGVLDEDQYKCYTKCQGNLPKLHKEAAMTRRVRPGPDAVWRQWKLDQMPEEDYKDMMRKLGVMQDDDRFWLEKSFQVLPTPSELTRWMVHDVFDEQVATEQDLDSQFTEKYTDDAKRYFEANGFTEQLAKNNWRAHWEYPSMTAAYMMLHQLRPGRVSDDLAVDEKSISRLLAINDMAPKWIDRLLAISYMVPTRMDLKQGYFIDALDQKEVKEGLLDVGYNKDSADQLLKVYDKQKAQYQTSQATRLSSWTAKSIAKAFGAGEIDEEEARQLLKDLSIDQDKHDQILASGRTLAKALARRQCIKGIKQQYMVGAIKAEEISGMLSIYGIAGEVADSLQNQYECERNSKVKQAGANVNVKWFVNGVIDLAELEKRLNNLNYTAESIDGYLSEAIVEQREKREREERAALARAQAADARMRAACERENRRRKKLGLPEIPCPP